MRRFLICLFFMFFSFSVLGTTGGSTASPSTDAEFNDAINQFGTTFGNLRQMVYVVSGFSFLGFCFFAISGKVKWGWVAMLALCLFVLSSAEMLVNYLMNNEGESVNYLPSTGVDNGVDAGLTSSEMKEGFDYLQFEKAMSNSQT